MLRGVAQFGRALGSGSRGRRFKSCHPDFMSEFFVYVLRSTVTGRLYIGSAANLDDRIWRHNSGQSKATRHGCPWCLIYHEAFQTRSEAEHRERELKTGKGRDELKRLCPKQLT